MEPFLDSTSQSIRLDDGNWLLSFGSGTDAVARSSPTIWLADDKKSESKLILEAANF